MKGGKNNVPTHNTSAFAAAGNKKGSQEKNETIDNERYDAGDSNNGSSCILTKFSSEDIDELSKDNGRKDNKLFIRRT